MDERLVSAIRERYQRTQERIALARQGAGNPRPVRLVVVSKAQPLEVVEAALLAGITALGENYAEEALAKIQALGRERAEWHMIGHVQSRKADLVAANFDLLHSLDSLKLAARLERFCAAGGHSLPVLLEVNVSGEESKFGFPAWDEAHWPLLLPEFESLLQYPHLSLRGLMTMPPYFEDPQLARPYFVRLRRLQEYLGKHLPQADWAELSMGTSADFETAVQEGASMVRVGQAILGARQPKMEVK